MPIPVRFITSQYKEEAHFFLVYMTVYEDWVAAKLQT